MNCENIEAKLLDYIDGELSPAQNEEIIKHLTTCKHCSELLKVYQRQERLLEKYYLTLNKSALGMQKPDLQDTRVRPASSSLSYYYYPIAAAFALIILSGVMLFVFHKINQSKAGTVLAKAKQVMGRVQYLDGKELKNVTEGMVIKSDMRLKTNQNSYLALELLNAKQGKNTNIVEVKGNSSLSLLAYKDKNMLNLERGNIWVHLNEKTDKPFVVKTKQLLIRDKGTIFNVIQGLAATSLVVLSGAVDFDYNGSHTVIEAVNSFSTLNTANSYNYKYEIEWSHFREKLLAYYQSDNAEQTSSNLLQVRSYEAPQPNTSIIEEKGFCQLSTTQLLPVDTKLFIEIANTPEIINEWVKSNYSKLFNDPTLKEWWNKPEISEVRDKINKELGLPIWTKLVNNLSGILSMSYTPEDKLLILADCRNNFDEMKRLVEQEIIPFMNEKFKKTTEANPDFQPVNIKNGFFIFATEPTLLKNTLKAIETNTTTGFTETRFYQNLRNNVPQSRLTLAYDFKTTVDAIIAKDNADINKFLLRTGFDGLDYVLGSPDFAGKGMNQAFRIAFTGPRHGISGWLDEPSPMSSLRFYSPDVHLFLAAKIKRPEIMLEDLVSWHCEDNKIIQENLSELAKITKQLASCFGNEVAIGLQNPVLPIPNVQVAIEVTDPILFHDTMMNFIDKANEEHPNNQIIMDGADYRDHLIVTLSGFKTKINISYVVLEDFVVFGLGEPYLRMTVDTFEDKHSIMDEYAFINLLPETGQMNFSILFYQDLTKSIPQLVNHLASAKLSSKQQAIMPNFDVMKSYGATGISYALSNDKYIDIYINGSSGVDFNMGGIVPMVANFLTPKLLNTSEESKWDIANTATRVVATAVEAYHVDNNHYPDSLDDLLAPIKYLENIPFDPYSESGKEQIQYVYDRDNKSYIIYSIGPDKVDNLGVVAYDPSNGINSSGDIIIKSKENE